MEDTQPKALIAITGSSRPVVRERWRFVRASTEGGGAHVRHVVDSPWWLLWLFVRPEKRAMARWNRLEQAEVAAQTASLNLRPPASCDSFVRAAALSCPRGSACPQ